jgi:hypothetical protein
MAGNAPLWGPRYTIAPAIAAGLMEIDAARAVVEHTPLPPAAESETVTTRQIAALLGLSPRMARLLAQQWVADGWLAVANPSNRARCYALSASYRQYAGQLTAMA